MSKKIFFFDIDGTLRTFDGVSPRVKKAINDIQAKGHLCFVASGRPCTFIQPDILDVGFDGYVLCNGAFAKTKDKTLYEVKMNDEYFKPLLKCLRDSHSEYILQSKDACYLDRKFVRLKEFYDRIHIKTEEFIYDFNEDEILDDINKIEIWPDRPELYEDFKKQFPHYIWHQYVNTNMEIYLNTISKAWGIKQVVNYYGIEDENVYCFGDGTNDIEMLNAVENSYAMGNASDAVKKEAKFVCPSVEEDGIAVILESFL